MNPIADDKTAPLGRDEEAADWCVRLAEDSLRPDGQRAFDAWLTWPGNHEAFEDAVLVWQAAEGAAGRPETIRLRTRALDGFRRAQHRRWTPAKGKRRWPLAVAAVLLAALCAAWWLRDPVRIYETGIGERRVALLQDGSRLSLDAATRVEVRIGDDRRELKLVAGRARFDVAKDALRPFAVTAGDKMVVATGTAFSVELVQRRMRVVLYEGRVEVLERTGHDADDARPTRLPLARPLTPGHELVAMLEPPAASRVTAAPPATAATIVPVAAGLDRASAWENGQLDFVNEPLSLAVARVNRYASERLVVRDPTIATLPVNGVFTAGDTEAFVEGVTRLLPVRAQREDGQVVLASR